MHAAEFLQYEKSRLNRQLQCSIEEKCLIFRPALDPNHN